MLSYLIALSQIAAFPAHAASSCQLVENGFGPKGNAPVKATEVVSGLEVPWALAFLPSGDILVTERPGRLRLVRAGKLVPEPVAKIDVIARGEGGLLGLALHPQFSKNHLLYVYYTAATDKGPVNRIARYRLSDDESSAKLDRVVFDHIPAGTIHDGGRLRFGPDGMLYASAGETSHPALAQDLKTPAGKILRLTPEGEVPKDNPWKGNPAYLIGVRNSEAFDWLDAKTMVVADHGPSGELGRTGHDEVNLAHAGDNLGWPAIYGCDRKNGMVTPLLTWQEANPPGGGSIYHGKAFPEWTGTFLFGGLGSRHLHHVAFTGNGGSRTLLQHDIYFLGEPPAGFGRLREVVSGPEGELYVTTSNCDGRGACPAEKDRILRLDRIAAETSRPTGG